MIFPSDLAILDCGVSDESMKAVRQVFNSFRSTLGVSTDIAAEKCSPASAKSYLLSNTLRFCVLMVDAKTVKDVYESWPQIRAEYEDLLRTAANKVGKRDTSFQVFAARGLPVLLKLHYNFCLTFQSKKLFW